MTDYDTEFDRLSKIIVADGSTDDQREAARNAIKVLTDQGIAKHFERIKSRTAKYTELSGQLAAIVDGIMANQLTDAIDKLNSLTKTVTEVAGELTSGDGSGGSSSG